MSGSQVDPHPAMTPAAIESERRAQVLALPQWTLLRCGWMPESGNVQGGVFYRVGDGLGPAGRDDYHTDVLRRAVAGTYDRPWGIEVLASPARVAVVRPTRAEIEETIQRERGQDLRRWTPAGVVDILVEAGYLDVTG